ncbi:carbohydrate ABC transporter permease [Paenibacillus psychroresistens]|uniref:Carbohydrate ABC transporter permease n=1 Tax=Paenibacillus psychroresistens TaxID=1778678 RepID=A0A6B8RQJ9_9BACL|nr:carbohydrate ABC transporter permease [Paenibacillus psychroresistens]QGQ97763.1 carbohydrate ABC transporter permease [Paenibacillus psychroresistens]
MIQSSRISRGLANLVLSLVMVVLIAPMLLIINVSLKNKEEFLNFPVTIVKSIHWRNFHDAWVMADMGVYFKNSILLTVLSAGGTCLIATLAAYPIARKHFVGANAIYLLFLSALFLPVGLVPLLFVMKSLGFINTYYGFIFLKIGGSLSIATFILVGFIKGVPKELDEAAAIDGCGYLRFIMTIMFPLILPAASTVLMLVGMGVWNDFIGPLIFLTDKSMRPLTAGLYIFFGQYSTNWTILAAAVIMVSLPLIVAYVFLQRFIVSGVTSGAIKG